MGFKNLSAEKKPLAKAYSEFLDRDMAPEEIANHSDDVVGLFYEFKNSIR